MLILALESSGKSLSCALMEDEKLIAERILNQGYTHSETLMPAVCGLLEDTGVSFDDLELLACSEGPGSYTGIRIGMSAMMTLAWEKKLPLYGVSSLDALAFPFGERALCTVPVIDARRGRIYAKALKNGKEVLPEENLLAEEFAEKLKTLGEEEFLLLGNGASVLYEKGEGLPLTMLPEGLSPIRGMAVGRLALERFCRGEEPSCSPRYLSLSQAERMKKAHA